MTDHDPRENSIQQFLHCAACMDQIPEGVSPREWAQLEVGWTSSGIQVWCKRHNYNVVHIDFEGHQHPTRTDRLTDAKKGEHLHVVR